MKFFKYFGIVAIMLFSFYYTDKIANLVLEKNELYQKIASLKDNYKTESVGAVITDDYIIPGLVGSEVNVLDSYYNMKNINVFNEYYLVYQDILPQVSLENNMDKIIKQGNPLKNSVAFILEEDETILNYFLDNYIKADVLINLENYNKYSNLELINNDLKNYEKVENLLNNKNLNQNLCVLNSFNNDICREKKKYLIEPKLFDNSNFLELKKNINKGDIYLIKKGTKLENIKLFIKDLAFKDLNIIYLSELISEK